MQLGQNCQHLLTICVFQLSVTHERPYSQKLYKLINYIVYEHVLFHVHTSHSVEPPEISRYRAEEDSTPLIETTVWKKEEPPELHKILDTNGPGLCQKEACKIPGVATIPPKPNIPSYNFRAPISAMTGQNTTVKCQRH